MKAMFWTLAALATYVYAGYPLLLALVRALGGTRTVRHDESTPTITLIISAFNEENVIADKLRNCLALDYPRDRLRMIVISDASDDRTDSIVESYGSQGVELLRMADRGGKTVGLNAAMKGIGADIVVFSDANAMYRADVLRMIARNFADPEVGGVIGQSTYVDPEAQSERSEGLYWRYELLIKRLESHAFRFRQPAADCQGRQALRV
jgi:cellulose synthase/poly-beta-1,6-N-acetylglucosamine synthase-like glycosyltransferase